MPALRKKRSLKKVPAIIYFRQEKNEKDNRQSCVYAECTLSGIRVGPVWGHTDVAIRKAVSDLTRKCDCPARFHSPREFSGRRNQKSKTT